MPVFSVPDLYFILGFRSPSESEVSQMITTAQQSSVLPGAQGVSADEHFRGQDWGSQTRGSLLIALAGVWD